MMILDDKNIDILRTLRCRIYAYYICTYLRKFWHLVKAIFRNVIVHKYRRKDDKIYCAFMVEYVIHITVHWLATELELND